MDMHAYMHANMPKHAHRHHSDTRRPRETHMSMHTETKHTHRQSWPNLDLHTGTFPEALALMCVHLPTSPPYTHTWPIGPHPFALDTVKNHDNNHLALSVPKAIFLCTRELSTDRGRPILGYANCRCQIVFAT